MTTTPWLPAAVATAADALRDAAHHGGGELAPMSVVDLADLGGSLEALLARLGTWTDQAVLQVADLPRRHRLRDDTATTDPGVRCLQAADHLVQVGTHLAAARAAAAAYHEAIAHLAHDDEPGGHTD